MKNYTSSKTKVEALSKSNRPNDLPSFPTKVPEIVDPVRPIRGWFGTILTWLRLNRIDSSFTYSKSTYDGSGNISSNS